jgi:hypothetical protein
MVVGPVVERVPILVRKAEIRNLFPYCRSLVEFFAGGIATVFQFFGHRCCPFLPLWIRFLGQHIVYSSPLTGAIGKQNWAQKNPVPNRTRHRYRRIKKRILRRVGELRVRRSRHSDLVWSDSSTKRQWRPGPAAAHSHPVCSAL